MAAISITCKPMIIPDLPPGITIPHYGVFRKAYEFLDGVPDPMEVLLKMQDILAAQLAPVRRFLEVVEALISIQQCIAAIPKAIMELNPGPIFDCFKALLKAMGVILSFIPPFSYVRTSCDLLSICIDLVDAITTFFQRVDVKITAWLLVLTEAEALGDLELANFTTCGLGEVKLSVKLTCEILRFVWPINQLFIDVFLRLIPSPQLREQAELLIDLHDYYNEVAGSIVLGLTELPGLPRDLVSPPPIQPDPRLGIPPLSKLFEAMNLTRSGSVIIYNVLAPTVGLEANKTTRETPTFVNF